MKISLRMSTNTKQYTKIKNIHKNCAVIHGKDSNQVDVLINLSQEKEEEETNYIYSFINFVNILINYIEFHQKKKRNIFVRHTKISRLPNTIITVT